MNEIQIFSNPDFGQMRTLTIDGEPWFVGKDVAQILGYSNTKDAINTHVDSDDNFIYALADMLYNNRGMAFSGSYQATAEANARALINSYVLELRYATEDYGEEGASAV